MAKLAQLPEVERSRRAEPKARVPLLRTRFYAFLSYSHKDKDFADWLHRKLEKFHVPNSLAGKLTANGVVPRRLTPVFRDEQDLSAGGELADEIKSALAASQFLVVLCSPSAVTSKWTNKEIESFKRTRPEGCVLAAIVAGEPFASDLPGRADEECFPPALRFRYDRRGHRTPTRADPLAADFRQTGEGKRLAFLKLVAGMLGVGLDELVRREQTRRQRRLAYLAAASVAGMAVTTTLAVAAFQARNEARDQRRQAEGLISFMLGDLKHKLEPIGRLDALDGVGGKVLAYYQQQDMKALPDESLRQRASALSLMASVATGRGDLNGAMRLYREAMAGTAEAIRRKPNDPQRYFDHAQNVFYVGSILLQRGEQKPAMTAFQEYKALSDKEVALDPNNITWRMEVQSADANLGIMLFNERRFPEAAAQQEQSLSVIEGIVRVDPSNMDYQKTLSESLAWTADSKMAEGHLDEAIASREREVALLKGLLARTRDSEFARKLIPAQRMLGLLYATRGHSDRAMAQLQEAADESERLFAVEPNNTDWIWRAGLGHLDMSDYLLGAGKIKEAGVEIATGCRLASALVARDSKEADWRKLQKDCFEAQANLALASGVKPQAISYAAQAVAAAKLIRSTDPIEDRYGLARAYRCLGDAERSAGDAAAARAAWMAGLSAIPLNVTERPPEISQHQMLLQRLERRAEAAQLANRLSAIGYREPQFRSA